MLRNNLKTAIRFFAKNKLFTIINISGLAIGIAAFLLLTQYVIFERSYDEGLDDVYRVTIKNSRSKNDFDAGATNHPAVGPSMKNDFPEVKNYARIVDAKALGISGILSYEKGGEDVVKVNSNNYNTFLADNSFLEMFELPMEKGNSEFALTEPNTAILSSTVAHQFFGSEDPIGKELTVNGDDKIKVTGVFKDLAQNTHLNFDILLSFSTLNEAYLNTTWVWPEFYNYIQLKEGFDPQLLAAKLPGFIQKYLGDIMKEYGFTTEFTLQPVGDIHLKSHLNKEMSANTSEGILNFLMIVAVFVIGIALINFINLGTSKSLERAKEVGLKKIVGAGRRTLIFQFLSESMIINFISIIIALLLISLLMKPFNNLVGLEILSRNTWSDPLVWVIVFGVFVIGGILAGLYPAFVLSGFKPITVLKGKFHKSRGGIILKKGLVITQFAISIALISGTLIVYSQFVFMQNQNLGFKANQNLIIAAPVAVDSTAQYRIAVFKDELIRDPNIHSVTATSDIPGKPLNWTDGIRIKGNSKGDHVPLNFMSVDQDFLDTYKMNIVAGRKFIENDKSDYYPVGEEGDPTIHRVILNEAVVKSLGFSNPEEAINNKVVFKYGPVERIGEVIGVVENYHQQSLQRNFENIMFMYDDRYVANYLTINLSGNNVNNTLQWIETEYDKLFTNDPFTYFFLDEYFDRQYKADLRFETICLLFSILAIFIASLGLFALGSQMALEKVKEISIRKVLGANILQSLLLIPKSLLGLVIISGTLATPIVYLITNNWLENYAFKAEIGFWMFLLPIILVLIVASISILAQSLKTAFVNPAVWLRSE